MTILPEETLDDLTVGDLKILQAKSGYRFSIDPVLLNAFILESVDKVSRALKKKGKSKTPHS